MLRLFKDFAQKIIDSNEPISNAGIKRALNTNVEGKKILQDFTLFQIENRVKYERRIKRRKMDQYD